MNIRMFLTPCSVLAWFDFFIFWKDLHNVDARVVFGAKKIQHSETNNRIC